MCRSSRRAIESYLAAVTEIVRLVESGSVEISSGWYAGENVTDIVRMVEAGSYQLRSPRRP